MKKIILITGLMLSANLWAVPKADYVVCSSFDGTKIPQYDTKYLEECVEKYLRQRYMFVGDPFIGDGNVVYQVLYDYKN